MSRYLRAHQPYTLRKIACHVPEAVHCTPVFGNAGLTAASRYPSMRHYFRRLAALNAMTYPPENDLLAVRCTRKREARDTFKELEYVFVNFNDPIDMAATRTFPSLFIFVRISFRPFHFAFRRLHSFVHAKVETFRNSAVKRFCRPHRTSR